MRTSRTSTKQTSVWLAAIALTISLAVTASCGVSAPDDCSSVGRCPARTNRDAAAEAVDDEAPAGDGGNDAGENDADVGADVQAAAEASFETSSSCSPAAHPSDEPCLVDDAFGVFVSASGRNGGTGAKTDPAKTIADGI